MRRAFDSISRGILLIVLGLIFILINYGYLHWSFWTNVADLWPLLLVLAGVGLLLNRHIPFSAVLVVFLLILTGYSVTYGDRGLGWAVPFGSVISGEKSLDVHMEPGIEKANLKLNVGGAGMQVLALTPDAANQQLLRGNYQWSGRGIRREPDFSSYRSGNTMNITLNSQKFGSSRDQLNLELSPKIKYSMDINAGAISGDIDVSQIALDDFELNTGASDFRLLFGDTGTVTQAKVSSGASKINLVVPDNVGLRVHFSGVVSNTNFMGSGLVLDNKDWVSSNYDQAKSKINLDISTAAGTVNLERGSAGSGAANRV